ncbi:MAG TPA: DUF4037 domain-containing protein [Pyrinomonadaceae bacterium]|jgi:hypothetical protein
MSQPAFISGRALSEAFYREAVRPLFDAHFPTVPHAAALVGWGSDVLGYDDAQSTDHFWGPRCYIFLAEPDRVRYAEQVGAMFGAQLPYTFRGYPTNFEGEHEGDVRRMKPRAVRPVAHQVYCESVQNFCQWYLGCDPLSELSPAVWLSLSEHKLLGVTAGRVFHDGLGELTEVRRRLGYYPRDVWLCLLAAQWLKLSEEEAFVGRCGQLGDELGSAVIAARQVKNLMRLCFFIERKYAPYSKWFGTGFAELACAAALSPTLRKVLQSATWAEREAHMALAYEAVAARFNALGVAPPVAPETRNYYQRPFRVLHAERFAEATWAAIGDEWLRHTSFSKGSINQWVDSDNRVAAVDFSQRLRALYE